jgi:hypothetical protein
VGWSEQLSRWLARRASGVIADPRAADAVVGAVGAAQRAREAADQVQTAAWHFTGLPSRRDVHRLFRRSASIAHKLVELERAVTRLERRLDDEDAARHRAAIRQGTAAAAGAGKRSTSK